MEEPKNKKQRRVNRAAFNQTSSDISTVSEHILDNQHTNCANETDRCSELRSKSSIMFLLEWLISVSVIGSRHCGDINHRIREEFRIITLYYIASADLRLCSPLPCYSLT